MTLLVQTESRIQQRKERRRNARGELFSDEVRAALDIAKGEVDRMQVCMPLNPSPHTSSAAAETMAQTENSSSENRLDWAFPRGFCAR